MQNYIGKTLNEAVQSAQAVNDKIRILQEGKENIITADWHPNRYNLYIDENNVVVRVEMG